MLRTFAILNRKLEEVASPDAPVHLYIAPDEAERQYLTETLKIDPHTLNSALDPDELGRVESEPDHLAIIFKRPKQYSSDDNFLFKINSVGLFRFAAKLVIIVAEDNLHFEGRQFANLNAIDDLLLKILQRSIQHFEEHLRAVSMISDELEHEINKAMENRHLLNMFTLEKSLVYYLNAISSNGRVLFKIKSSAPRFRLSEEDVEFLEDVIIENNQCLELANTYSQVLSSLMDARVSIVSNNLNVLMKTLTIVMITIMMPTLVISVFSMNVKLPMDQEHSLLPFWLIMVAAAASGFSVLFVRHLKKW